MEDTDGQRKRAFVVVRSGSEHDNEEDSVGDSSTPGEALPGATVLQRNPACNEAESDRTTQATLAVEVDGEPCDCIYISQAAVEAHKLPAPAGWYVEMPDEKGVQFSVRHSVKAQDYPVVSKVFVDGQQACRWELKNARPRLDHGFWCESQGSKMAHVRPFKLQKLESKYLDCDPIGAGDQDDATSRATAITDEDGARTEGSVGTITLMAWRATMAKPSPAKKKVHRDYPQTFVPHDVAPKKKALLLDQVVKVGAPHRTNRKWVRCAYQRGSLLLELTLHYRTRRFFDTLQGHIDTQGTYGMQLYDTVSLELRQHSTGGTLNVPDASVSCGGSEGAIVEAKQEPEEDTPSALANFVHRLARTEKLRIDAARQLRAELAGRKVRTAHDLKRLTRAQWRDIVHSIGMPASLARSAMKLASPTPSPSRYISV